MFVRGANLALRGRRTIANRHGRGVHLLMQKAGEDRSPLTRPYAYALTCFYALEIKDLAANQSVFEFRAINGTIVGFYTPEYAEGLNVPGYHLHLITADRTAGGHVLDLKLNNSDVFLDITPEFHMVIPSSEDFIGVDLTKDLQDDLKEVEQ